jgi:hypothetical protein
MMLIRANGKGMANLVIKADANVAPGDYGFNISAGDGVVEAEVPATVTVSTDIQTGNIVATVQSDREDVAPGEKFACITTITNTGNTAATNVHLNFGFQGAARLMNLRGTAGTCTTGVAGEMYCDVPSVPAGGNVVITADMAATDIGQILFTMDATGQNVTATQAATSASYSLQVSDFQMAPEAPASSVVAGQSATYSLTVAPTFLSFDRAVTLTCSGLPALASCNFSQNNFMPKAGMNVTVTITTKGATTAQNVLADAPVYAWLPFASIFLLGTGAVRRKRTLMAVTLAVVLVLGLTGCHGFFVNDGTSAAKSPTPTSTGTPGSGSTTPSPSTPAGTYTILVTASAGSVQHTTSVTLNVQ